MQYTVNYILPDISHRLNL